MPAATDKTVKLRIERALAKPGATGKRGFLLWVEAAFPKEIAGKILEAAKKQLPPQPAAGTLGYFGDTISVDPNAGGMTTTFDPSDPTTPPVSPTTAATSSSAADNGWLGAIGNAIQAAGQAYLTKTQVDAASQIFQVNLQRAQQGLAPIATDPTKYGLPSPTVNVGLAAKTQSALLWVAGGLGALVLLSTLMRPRGR